MAKSTKSPTVPAPELPYKWDWADYSLAAILGLALTVVAMVVGASIQRRLTPPVKTHRAFVEEKVVTEKVCPSCRVGLLKDSGYSVSQARNVTTGDTVEVWADERIHTCNACDVSVLLKWWQSWPMTTTTLKPR